MRKKEKREWSAHGVIVTVYEELSSTVGSRSRPGKTQTKNSNPTTRSTGGYDRRAELLAYAHQLRNVGPHQIHNTPTDSYPPKPKERRRWLGRLKTLKVSFGRLFGGEKNKAWKYENIESRRGENTHRSRPPRCRGRNRWSTISMVGKSGLTTFMLAMRSCSVNVDLRILNFAEIAPCVETVFVWSQGISSQR